MVETFLPRGPNQVADIFVNVLRMKGMATPTKTAAKSVNLKKESHMPIEVIAIANAIDALIPYVSIT